MECGDKPNADINSMDLYSRVKLRGLRSKARDARKDIFPATESNVVSAGLRKSKDDFVKQRFSLDLATVVENQAGKNASAVETARSRSLMEVTVDEIDEWKNFNKDLGLRRAKTHDFHESNDMLDEGTAVETLGQLREGRTKNFCNQFDIGDLVWGKIKPHPWWPGQIFNEALASSSVLSAKGEGCVLVAFFGDYTYGWLHPQHLVPFDIHYAGKSRQPKDRVFLQAVREAIREYKRRAVLGLVCHCLNPPNFRPIGDLFEVDFNGFIAGGIYSGKQIDQARNDFQPDETLALMKQMAISPRNTVPQYLSLVKNTVRIVFYRRAALQNFEKTNAQAIEVQQRSSQDPISSLVEKAALLAPLEAKSRENQVLKQPTKAIDFQNKDNNILGQKHRVGFSRGRFSHQGSIDHEMQIPSKISGCIVSEGPHDKTLQKQIRPDGAANTDKKRNISGLPELASRKKPVRHNNMDLSMIASNQKLFELPGEESIGIETSSSIKLEKELEMETNCIRSNVEPGTLIIKFPPGTLLPSVSELKAKFSCFGPLVESSVGMFWKFSRCQIVFQDKTDAAAAYLHVSQIRTLFGSQVSCELQAVSVGGSELPKSSESLTNLHQDIQPLTLSNRAEFIRELRPTFRHFPLLENIKREPCLEELAQEGPSCASAFATPLASYNDDSEIPQNMIPVGSPWTYPLCCTTEQFGFNQNVDGIDNKYCQDEAMKNNDHHTSTSASGIEAEKKNKLINLLHSCSDILGEIKHLI